MNDRKYEFTGETKTNAWGVTVQQIRATVDIPRAGVKKGDIGGWIESAELRNGDALVYGNAWVSGNAWVYGNAWVSGDAQVEQSWQFLAVGPIGSEGVTATLFRTEDGKHILNVGCWTGTLGTLSAEVKRRRESWTADQPTQDVWTAQYKALTSLGKATVARWEVSA
jgi:hypothetical protein